MVTTQAPTQVNSAASSALASTAVLIRALYAGFALIMASSRSWLARQRRARHRLLDQAAAAGGTQAGEFGRLP
jgi:hypothetical protein